MKKFLLILCSMILLTGCSSRTVGSVSVAEQMQSVVDEIITEPETKKTTKSNVYEKQTYREVLEGIYYNREFPDWDYKNYTTDVSIEFAVYDIDSDGRDELLITFDQRGLFVYDHNADGNLVKQFSGYIRSDFYENGAVRVYSAHNQTHSFKVHPFAMYKYNNETDSYDECEYVYGIDKNIVDIVNRQIEEAGGTEFFEYPAEYDKSSSGTVYYIRSDDETEIPLDLTEYNEYYGQFTENTDIIDIQFVELTEENIENVDM